MAENRENLGWTVHIWGIGSGGTDENPFWTDLFTFVDAPDLVQAIAAYLKHNTLKPGEIIYKVREHGAPVGTPYAYAHPHFNCAFEGKGASQPLPEFKELYGYYKREDYYA